MTLIWGLLLFWRVSNTSFQALWMERWAILITLITIFFVIDLISWRKKIYTCLVSYLIAVGLASAYLPQIHSQDATTSMIFQNASLMALLPLFCFLLFMKHPLDIPRTKLIALSAGLLTALGVILAPVLGHKTYEQVLLLSNPSMAGTFIALSCMDVRRRSVWVFVTIAILLTGALTPILLWSLFTFRKVNWLTKLLIFVGGTGVAIHHTWPWDDGRAYVWRLYAHFLMGLDIPKQVFGLGLGTTRVWIPLLQNTVGTEPVVTRDWLWAHNDWLQILGELGVVGLLLSLGAAITLMVHSSQRNKLFLLGFGLAMLTNYPLHFAPTALLLWVVIHEEGIVH